MKKLTRILALLMALAMLSVSLLACGGNTDDPGNTPGNDDGKTSGNELKPNVPDDLKFEGTTVRFIVSDGDEATGSLPSRSIAVDEDADMGFSVNKAVSDRNLTIKDRLGVTVELKTVVDQGAMSQTLSPILLSGLDEYDVVGAYQYYDLGLTIGENVGTFLNYNKIDEAEMYIDVTKPYWDKGTYDELAYKGAAYWITGDISQTWVGSIYVSIVNERLWNLYAEQIETLTGYSSIYDVVENDKWTLDLWCELSKLVYVDSVADDQVGLGDQVGFLTYEPSIINIMADGLAAGSHINYTKWVDGIPQVSFYTNTTIDFANKMYQLYFESSACKVAWDDNAYILDMFAEGNALMTVNLLHNTEMYLADMKDNYYIVPVPKLTEAQDYSTVIHDNMTLFGIPKSCSNVAATTATLELMAYYSYTIVTPEYYDVALKERYTRDPEAAAMIDEIRASLYSDFVMLWGGKLDSPTHFFRSNITKRFTSVANSKEKSWQKSLTKLLTDLENSTYID